MAKFGELISSEIPVLIDFYAEWEEENSENLHVFCEMLLLHLGDKAKVIKIDIEKNETLANALRIKGNPTFIIYKDGEMKWRQSGDQDANTLISLVQQYV